MIDIGGSLITFLVLFPTALGISAIYFYFKREARRKKARKTEEV